MDHSTYISFLSYRGLFPGPVCLPDHDDEPMKKHTTPVLDLFHGKGSRETNLLKRIPTEKDFAPDSEQATERYLLHTAPGDERDFFAAFKNRGVYCSYSGWDGTTLYDIHHHSPLYVTLPLEKNTVQLYDSICDTGWLGTWRGDFLSSIGIYFYRYNNTFRKEMEYYRMLFKHAKLTSVRLVMPNIKDGAHEKNPGFLEVGFVYQYVLYLHGDGYLLYETRNDEVYDPMDRRNDFREHEPEPVEEVIEKPPFTLNYQSITMVEPEKGFEVEKPFRCKINTIMSRKLAPEERKMGYMACSLESSHKNKVVACNVSTEGNVYDTDGNIEVQFSSLVPHPDWKKEKEKDPDDPPQYRVKVENKHVAGLFGYSEWVKVPKPPKKILIPGFVDCHMHTNPPKGSPLPTIWVQNGFTKALKPDWEDGWRNWRDWKKLGGIDGPILKPVEHIILRDLTTFSEDTTEQLGAKVLDISNKVLQDSAVDKYMVPAGERKRIMIDLPLDIEMAHFEGYYGKPVYQQNEKGEVGYWMYEKAGKRVWRNLHKVEALKLTTLDKQKVGINNLFSANQGAVLAFYPFDPRHWLGTQSPDSLGTWHDTLYNLIQFSDDKKRLSKFTAIGYKIYTALGFRPDDYNDLPVTSRGSVPKTVTLKGKLRGLRDFYSTCVEHKIPITCHCSRGGVFAYDFMLYYDNIFPTDDALEKQKKEYFQEYYISPFAWERVLHEFPELYLNLAHFGGEEEWAALETTPMPWAEKMAEMAADPKYPNFYIDIAYFLFRKIEVADCEKGHCDRFCPARGKTVLRNPACPIAVCREIIPAKEKLAKMLKRYPKLKEKLLFGTDWYLISSEEKKYGHYDNYFKGSIKHLAEIDPELPAYTMVINPKRFLNLEAVSQKIAAVFGEEFNGLCAHVSEKMHDSIEKYYV